MVGVQTGRLRPGWPRGSPNCLLNLAERCWAHQPSDRPTFLEIIETLNKVRGSVGQGSRDTWGGV